MNEHPARKRSRWRWLAGGIGAVMAVVLATQLAPSPGGPALAACEGSFTIDFAGFPAGTIAGEQYADKGVHISARANEGHPDAIVVFDSNAPATHDPDLEVHIGNILVLAENVNDENGDGLVDDPDENNFGGTQIYEFDQPVHIGSFKFVDKDHESEDTATAFDAAGNVVGSAPIVMMGNGSVQTVTLNADNVSRLEIDYRDSGALTGIEVTCQGAGGGTGPDGVATTEVSSLGFDSGGQTVAPGATNVTAGLNVVASDPGIASYQIEVTYDPALLTATSCSAPAGAACNHTANPNTVLFEGDPTLGMSPVVGTAELGNVTFTAGNTAGTSPLTVNVPVLQEPDGDNLSVTPTNGQITIVAPATATVSSLGFTPGVQTVATGTPNVAAPLNVVASEPGIASYRIEVTYNPALLRATGSVAPAGATSNHTANPGTVIFEGNPGLGLSPLVGNAELGKVTFTAGNTPGTSPLTVNVRVLQQPDGRTLSATPTNGQITIVQPEATTGSTAPTAVAAAVSGPQPEPQGLPSGGGRPGDDSFLTAYAALLAFGAALAAIGGTGLVAVYVCKRFGL